jgi:hypothetical protein
LVDAAGVPFVAAGIVEDITEAKDLAEADAEELTVLEVTFPVSIGVLLDGVLAGFELKPPNPPKVVVGG